MLQDTQPDIAILSEHGLKTPLLENTKLTEYSLKAHFCREKTRKGGVAIYVRDSLEQKTEAVDVFHHCKEVTCEAAMVRITIGKEHLYVTGVYRSPRGNLDEALEILSDVIEETKAENHPSVIMGDINVNRLVPDKESRSLEEMLASHNMTRLPLPATRITYSSATSIDCVCSNLPMLKIQAAVIHAGLSDHTAQLSTISLKSSKKKETTSFLQRQMHTENLDSLNTLLHEENWAGVFNAKSAEIAYNTFLNTLTLYMNTACPKKKIRSKSKNFTYKDKETLRLKDIYLQCLITYQTTGSHQHKTDTAVAKKNYDLHLKMLKREYSANHINRAENKSKAVWQIVNKERKNPGKEQEKLKLKINGIETDNPEEIVDNFNSFFTKIAQKTLAINTQHQKGKQNIPHSVDCMLNHLSKTTTEEVQEVIKSMKSKTSAGLDDVSSKLLKYCMDALTPPLVSVINKSFSTGLFPSALKVAKVYPKHKTGCKMTPSNYRPISLISTFSKVIEKIVLKRLMDYIEQHSLLTSRQHGFVKGKSTTTAIAELAEFICDNLEAGKLVTGIMLDFSKAFDCLGHNHILGKLTNLGIGGSAHKWFQSYLEERSQVVEIKHSEKGKAQNIRSKPLLVDRGVPQGSVLGPVLFILFTNDMPHFLSTYCSTLMYADDTTLLLAGNSTEELAIGSHTALNMAYQYCHSNDLVVNMNKTKQLAFGRRRDEIPALPEVDIEPNATFLGLTIDETLSWSQHTDNLCKKLNTSLFVIKRILHISNPNTAKITYHSLFESHLRYGIVIWGGTTITNLQRILRVQKRVIRTLKGLGPRDSCREGFKDLRILTAVSLYIQEVILFVNRNELPRGTDMHHYNTRHADNYILPAHHLSLYGRKPTYVGRKLYNSLPAEIKTQRGKDLKTALNRWLVARPFYTLEEYLHRDQ